MPRKKPSYINAYPLRTPKFWHGMRMGDWFRLLWRNRFAVSFVRWIVAIPVTILTVFNTIMAFFQWLIHGRRIAKTELVAPPVFILGHWRSGTTFLHELMVLEDRFACPSTYECFAPHHFLLTEWWVAKFMKFLLPSQRPMDNVLAGWDRPQEDEFALCNLGAHSPYLRMAFPNRPDTDFDYLNFDRLTPAQIDAWHKKLFNFMQAVTYHLPRQLVMKSPPHTGRLLALSQKFPDAKFIHMLRDPYELFPSTYRLWESLDWVQGLQVPNHDHLDEYVFDCLNIMYEGFERQRAQIDPARVLDVRYEDLVRNPVEQMRRIYEHLGSSDFEKIKPKLVEYLGTQKDYQRNKHQMPQELFDKITQRWAGYIERYGYQRAAPAGK